MSEFKPVPVFVHEAALDWLGTDSPVINAEVISVVAADGATESGHPVVILQVGGEDTSTLGAVMSLKQFLTTVKLVMDAYPEYVREVYNL